MFRVLLLSLFLMTVVACESDPGDDTDSQDQVASDTGDQVDLATDLGNDQATDVGGDQASDMGSDAGDTAMDVSGDMGQNCPAESGLSGGIANIDLSMAGRPFHLDLATNDYAPRMTAGNGCAVTLEPNGGFLGAGGIRVNPPTSYAPGSTNAEYCGFASGAQMWSGATVDIAQLNVRYLLYVGPDHAEAAAQAGPKAIIPYVYDQLDSSAEVADSARPMVFWGSADPTVIPLGHVAVGVTSGTVQSYQEPETDYFPVGNGQDALYFGGAPDHQGAATQGTPVVGDEWVVIEHEWDMRQDRGNPEGISRLYVWTQDGVVAGTVMDIPLNWDAGHNFGGRYIGALDGIGFYYNEPTQDLADNYLVYSNIAFAANRAPGDPIGPPPGFLDACP